LPTVVKQESVAIASQPGSLMGWEPTDLVEVFESKGECWSLRLLTWDEQAMEAKSPEGEVRHLERAGLVTSQSCELDRALWKVRQPKRFGVFAVDIEDNDACPWQPNNLLQDRRSEAALTLP
jgi:hypothetical protein